MAQQPDTFDHHDVDVDDQAVLSTKLQLPRPPSTFIPRPRLCERLDNAGPGTAILVCAPAGCGKSVLISDWCRRRKLAAAWLSLERDDNDPIRFWRHVASSLDGAHGAGPSAVGVAVDRLIRGSGDPLLDEIATTVVNAVDDTPDDVVLVLDDYHVIEDSDVHSGVQLLIDHAPEQLRVLMISRADPPLMLARRRASGKLTEIRQSDLRFSAEEAAVFLSTATGRHLPAHAVSTLTDRTEGWAVGLQLAALSLGGRDDISTFLSTFSGSHRFVLDYLTEEVLDQQPAAVRDFLLSTSVLQRLSGSLCDAVTGENNGQSLLEACDRANLFLIPLDDNRRWWRYHHLFADLLRLRLLQRFPGRESELHRRAADWHESHGFIDEAISHAVAADDPDRAFRLIERHADELLFRREGATLRRYLNDLPTGATRRLLVAQARTAAYAGRLTEADTLIEAAAGAAKDPGQSFEPSVDRSASPLAELDPTIALLRAFVAHLRGQEDAALELAHRTLTELDDDPGSTLGLIAQWYLAVDPWLRGAVAEAESALAVDLDRWRIAGDDGRGALSGHYIGRVQRSRGDLAAAAETYRRVLSIALDDSAPARPSAAVGHVGLAEVAYQQGDASEARRQVTKGIALGRDYVYTQALSSGLATLAWIRQAEGDLDEAVAIMDEAVEVGPDSDVVDLLNPVPVQRAQLLLACGDERLAQQWTALRGVAPNDAPYHPAEPAHLLLARLLIHRGQGTQAIPLLDRLLGAATNDGRAGSVIEIEILRALALVSDDPATATRALIRAVALAAPLGHVRIFVDEGAPMAALLGSVIATPSLDDGHRLVLDHVAMLAREFERGPIDTEDGSPTRQPLVVPLTDRELEVLGQLATGRTNQEIADELYVSLHTVKKHVTHVLGKLGAANRTAAVDRARALDLL
ncbi:MAG: LuxR C-terminal-related transcriptional regulator [Acidimicrobiia bacterium]|nr:LuxR C-terminal-related transcriptional regulator [Acidimicrobiia bacterium]